MMQRASWLDGEWRELQGFACTRHSPVDGSFLAEYWEVQPAALDSFLRSRAAALPIALPLVERCEALRQLADALERDAPRLAALITLENGCPAAQAEKLQVHSAVALLRSMADIGEVFCFEELRRAARGGQVRVEYHPIGLAVGIVPWNVPLFLACAKLAASLIAGCPILLKPSPENASSMGAFAEHLAALPLPAGAVNLVLGGRELGAALVAHPAVAKVSFTGSTAAGRAVAEACARRLARCTLELGGKSAAILLDDVDFDAVSDELFLAMLQNNGQVCGAQSRLLVPRSREGELRDALRDLFDRLNVGDPRHLTTHIGPVVSSVAAQRIDALCVRAEHAGAQLLSRRPGERRPDGDAIVYPRLYAAADTDSELWCDEVFGPVVAVHSYRDTPGAVALANESRFGLSGSVWSSDPARAADVARGLRTGTVSINSKKILDFSAPFGGWRESGLGREFGPEGIREYLETKSVLLP